MNLTLPLINRYCFLKQFLINSKHSCFLSIVIIIEDTLTSLY
jgi:hypothetical protein